MPNKMLIDATHPEETRVVVVRGNRVEEFDFESAQRKQLRGNIYLAKVTRVEPSLQAAFIEYGGNRHGFLAFSEIHPDYYQIPVADRQALIEADERAHREAEEESENRGSGNRRRGRQRNSRRRDRGESVQSEVVQSEVAQSESVQNEVVQNTAVLGEDGQVVSASDFDRAAEGSAEALSDHVMAPAADAEDYRETGKAETSAPTLHEGDDLHALAAEPAALPPALSTEDGTPQDPVLEADASATIGELQDLHADALTGLPAADEDGDDEDEDDEEDDEDETEEEQVESVGGDDVMEEVPERAFRPRRQYKIQEVIKRRQVMLVQVVKEERGNKGAALTTYLSLAGRYAVLMPNTARGGGISRKITSAQDRSRLKDVVQDLDVPEGMGIILRTAGAARTKPEIKRDFEYLIRMWETVRDMTLKSQAPTLVYEEGSLIKRSLRDLYNKEIDEILVAGEDGYTEARGFMKMLMPTHARVVKLYRDPQPLFSRMGVESQLDAMFSATVQLRSGGYIVLNQTEALVSIDVNSGRSTREHHIEDTALKTNLEAAEEVARQLRLRDLAGLIVIDFIDMDEKRNNRSVERKMSDCLRHDRARIQVGRISHFGLLEMSRQRIRASMLESSTEICPSCGGTGHMRSVASVALQLLRGVEEALMKGATHNLTVRTRADVALYVLNHKRGHLHELEDGFEIAIAVIADPSVLAQQSFMIDRGEQVHTPDAARALLAAQTAAIPVMTDDAQDDEVFDEDIEAEDTEEADAPVIEGAAEGLDSDEDGRKRKRRRRRRGRGEARDDAPANGHDAIMSDDDQPRPSAEMAEDDGAGDTSAGDARAGDAGADDSGETDGDTRVGADGERRPRRRGRRGGRRRRGGPDGAPDVAANGDRPHAFESFENDAPEAREQSTGQFEPYQPDITAIHTPEPRLDAVTPTPLAEAMTPPPAAPVVTPLEPDDADKPARRKSTVREKVSFFSFNDAPEDNAAASPPSTPQDAPVSASDVASPVAPVAGSATDEAPRRAGWWSRQFGNGS